MSISFDDLAELKVGDIIFECEGGLNIKTKVLTVPIASKQKDGEERRTLKWDAENTEDKTPISYFVTEGYMHYGPRLYMEPQYCYRSKEGKFTFPLVGTSGVPDMYNKSTVYHAVMQKSTGKFLPVVETRGGYTHTEPKDIDHMQPRLHFHAGSARRAMQAYCQGRWENEYMTDWESGNKEPTGPGPVKGTGRDINDFEVRRIRLVVEEAETDLSDGRRVKDMDKYVRDTSPWAGEDPRTEGVKDPGDV